MYKQFLQLNMKNGNFVQIGLKDFEEFKSKRDLIILSKKEFVNVIDTCTVRKSDIVLIEYYVATEQQTTKKGGKKNGKES